MTLPDNAIETNCFIYVNIDDAKIIEVSPDFTPIRGQYPELHGIAIGYYNSKLVIIVRTF